MFFTIQDRVELGLGDGRIKLLESADLIPFNERNLRGMLFGRSQEWLIAGERIIKNGDRNVDCNIVCGSRSYIHKIDVDSRTAIDGKICEFVRVDFKS